MLSCDDGIPAWGQVIGGQFGNNSPKSILKLVRPLMLLKPSSSGIDLLACLPLPPPMPSPPPLPALPYLRQCHSGLLPPLYLC